MTPKRCAYCGTLMKPRAGENAYRYAQRSHCDAACSGRAKREPDSRKVCPRCGCTFSRCELGIGRPAWETRTYCSEACRRGRKAPSPLRPRAVPAMTPAQLLCLRELCRLLGRAADSARDARSRGRAVDYLVVAARAIEDVRGGSGGQDEATAYG